MKDLARTLRKDSTDAERWLWQRLRNRELLGCKFRRQHPIGCYIVDFVCIQKKLIIELDGSQHAQNQTSDSVRSEYLKEKGFRVLRFWNNDVLVRGEAVLNAILSCLNNENAPLTPALSPQEGERGRGGMKALLLLAFGGPRSLDEVEPFLTRLYRGKKPSPEQLKRVKERYRLIGGSSPLTAITLEQARALEINLCEKGHLFKAYVGMRYGHPLIEESLREIITDGIREVIALPMTPFRSRASTGAYVEEVMRLRQTIGEKIEVSFATGWHLHPRFIESIQERIVEGLNQFTPEERKKVHLIFTAHSLPKSFIENEPYVRDMEEAVREVLKKIDPLAWHIAFQSKGMGQGEWLGPDVETVLTELAQKEVKNVLTVPVGFVADHIEILYDIDRLYRQKAETLGMNLRRTVSLNDSRKFIEALATIIEEHTY